MTSPDGLLSERFFDALGYAARLHNRQVRKGGGTPYVSHLMAVASLVLEHGGSEDEAIAALLHDAIEDQAEHRGGAAALRAEIEQRYGARVLGIVNACTDAEVVPKPPWRARKEQYLRHLGATPDPAYHRVSIADKLHNARAILLDYPRRRRRTVAALYPVGPRRAPLVLPRFGGGLSLGRPGAALAGQ